MKPTIVFTESAGTTTITVALYGKCGAGRLDAETRIAKHRSEQLGWVRPKPKQGRPCMFADSKVFMDESLGGW